MEINHPTSFLFPNLRQRRRLLFSLALLLILAVLSLGSTRYARAATITLIQKSTVQKLTTSSMVIQWATKESGSSQVTYGVGNYGQTATAVSTRITSSDTAPYNDYYLHEATLTSLTANTIYQYKFFTGGAELGSSTARSGRSDSQTSFRFAALGDSGAASDGQRGVAARMLQVQPDLILHAGDMIYSVASYKDLNLKYFKIYEELLDNVWLAPSVGNHDYDYNSGKSIADSFANPTNNSSNAIERELYYSFDYGNAHFTVMTSELPSSNGSTQYNWAQSDLAASNKFWKIVVFHEPPYYGTAAAYGNLVTLFEQNGVDIVISGDRHFYERLKPLKGGQVTTIDNGGIFYVVTGGGGTGLGNIGSPPWPTRTAERARLFHFAMFDVNDCSIQFSAVERTYSTSDTFDSGDIFDSFTINKCSGSTVAPSANFSGTPTSGPGPLSVAFSDQSSGQPTSWSWNFGDGTTSTERNPTHIYSTPGTYTVSLTASNSAGSNTQTRSNYVTVYIPPSPTADFSATPLSGQAPLTVQFSDLSSNATSWLWNFGDGSTATVQNPSRTYTTAGTYNVTLTVTNSQGNHTRTRNSYITVTAPQAPVAAFSSSVQSGPSPLMVNFTDQSTNSPTSWLWNFGDGTTATTQNPSHTYATAGSYTVSLTATNGGGSDNEVKTNHIVVSQGPKLFTPTGDSYTKSSSPTASYGQETQMRNRTGSPIYNGYVKFNVTNLGGVVTRAVLRLFVVDGADNSGTAVLTTPNWSETTLTYGNAPALDGVVAGQLGATANNRWVEVDVTSVVTGEGEWSFGLRPVSTNSSYFSTKEGTNPPQLLITVTDGPPPAPTAAFSASPTSGNAPLTVQFSDQSTNSPTSWAWSFGDGGSSTQRNPSHTYLAPGTYTVALTASSSNGSDNEVKTSYITVTEPPAPVAAFTADKTSGHAPLAVQFTDQSTNSPTSWLWDFGDGNSSTERNPSHSYAAAGTYTVSLTATNGTGSDDEVKTNYITVTVPPAPTAAFTANKTSGTAPLAVQFTDQSTNSPTSWLWDFGDGNSSTERNPSHSYATAGSYTVSLTATNGTGSDDEVKTSYITVTEAPPPGANQTFYPTGDSHTKSSSPTSSYGLETQMRNRTGSPEYNAYVKFNVTGVSGPVTRATLRLFVVDGAENSGTAVLTTPNWSETSLTYSNAPALTGTVVGQLGATSNGSWVEVDVTSAVTGNGEWSFGLRPVSTNSSYFSTKEGSNPPQLVVEAQTGPAPAPVAAFTADKTSGNAPLMVQFTDQSSNSPTSWAWDFGDGNSSTERNPSHSYAAAGSYTVSLTATNGSGSDGEVKTSYIIVSDPPAPSAPVAAFTADKTGGSAPLAVQFTDQSTNSPTSWLWDFGDGNSSTSQNPSHSYATAGSYTVSLTATNGTGSDDEVKTSYITVTAAPPPGGSQTFYPTGDSHTKSSSPTSSYGLETQMRNRTGSPEYNAYVKFNVTGVSGPVTRATLRLFVVDGAENSGTAVLTTPNWSETTLTYSNAPALTGTVVGQLGATSNGRWLEIDVTSAVTGNGEWSFGLRPSSTNSSYFSTKEGSNPPELVIETGATGNAIEHFSLASLWNSVVTLFSSLLKS